MQCSIQLSSQSCSKQLPCFPRWGWPSPLRPVFAQRFRHPQGSQDNPSASLKCLGLYQWVWGVQSRLGYIWATEVLAVALFRGMSQKNSGFSDGHLWTTAVSRVTSLTRGSTDEIPGSSLTNGLMAIQEELHCECGVPIGSPQHTIRGEDEGCSKHQSHEPTCSLKSSWLGTAWPGRHRSHHPGRHPLVPKAAGISEWFRWASTKTGPCVPCHLV